MKKQYEDVMVAVLRLGEDILCTSGEVSDESNQKDNYFEDIWD